jgi:hypothetical protein
MRSVEWQSNHNADKVITIKTVKINEIYKTILIIFYYKYLNVLIAGII